MLADDDAHSHHLKWPIMRSEGSFSLSPTQPGITHQKGAAGLARSLSILLTHIRVPRVVELIDLLVLSFSFFKQLLSISRNARQVCPSRACLHLHTRPAQWM